jgi:hypothetical protein
MIPSIRDIYNQQFSDKKYHDMLSDMVQLNHGELDFRLAETPIFIDAVTKNKLLKAGDDICAFINSAEFAAKTEKSFSQVATPPNENELPGCIVMDFAICINEKKEIEPKLIELQGFPSLFGFEVFHDQAFQKHFNLPNGYSPYLNGYNAKSYLTNLQQIICGDKSQHTVLLELHPHQQKTKIDFYCTQQLLNIPIVCLSEIFAEGNELFYKSEGNKKRIDRIYNRIVWDEIDKQSAEMKEKAKLLLQNLKIEWVTHPNHFYRISKYIMPFLNSTAVPRTQFLNKLTAIPSDLENYVLKPLFSFAGQGVMIDVRQIDIAAIKDPENWILQQKVEYAPVIETPSGPAKTEVRLFYFRDQPSQKYKATLNLARISKGKMIGVSYNANSDWVGGSLAYFEK